MSGYKHRDTLSGVPVSSAAAVLVAVLILVLIAVLVLGTVLAVVLILVLVIHISYSSLKLCGITAGSSLS